MEVVQRGLVPTGPSWVQPRRIRPIFAFRSRPTAAARRAACGRPRCSRTTGALTKERIELLNSDWIELLNWTFNFSSYFGKSFRQNLTKNLQIFRKNCMFSIYLLKISAFLRNSDQNEFNICVKIRKSREILKNSRFFAKNSAKDWKSSNIRSSDGIDM